MCIVLNVQVDLVSQVMSSPPSWLGALIEWLATIAYIIFISLFSVDWRSSLSLRTFIHRSATSRFCSLSSITVSPGEY